MSRPAPSQKPPPPPDPAREGVPPLEALRTRFRRWRWAYKVSVYAAFNLWLFGVMLTIFSKGITLPGEENRFGSPLAIGMILAGLAMLVFAFWCRRQLARAAGAVHVHYGAGRMSPERGTKSRSRGGKK